MASGVLAQLIPPPAAAPTTTDTPPSTRIAKPEVRGVRLSLSSGDSLATYAQTAVTMRRLREAGFNTVYISIWNDGYTKYGSDVLRKACGVERDPTLPAIVSPPKPQGVKPEPAKQEYRDPIAEAIQEAHRNGLIAIGWFEGGFLASKKDADTPLKLSKAQWLSRNAQGKFESSDGSAWLNPIHQEVQQFMFDLVLEAADKFDLDGIQLDEHFTWPDPAMGYDEYTKKAFADEHFGQDPPVDGSNVAWLKWRADKSTEFLKHVMAEVAKSRPDYALSLSTSMAPDSAMRSLAPWATWSKAASWSEYVFRAQDIAPVEFEKTWIDQVGALAEARSKAILLIPVSPANKPFAWEDVKKMLEMARSTGSGHVFDLRGTSIDAIVKPMSEWYAPKEKGASAHPKFGPDYRPAPVKLRMNAYLGPMDSRVWRVMKPVPGMYQVSGVFDGDRRALTGMYITTATPKKAFEVATPKVFEDVEIIPDRRPFKPTAPKK